MFTGIVIEKGNIVMIAQTAQSIRIAARGPKSVKKAVIGSSISLNGACLTVTKIDGDVFEADVMPETVRRTNLAVLKPGNSVNLEPALRLGDELGGHMVSGHIDGTGRISSLRRDDKAIWMTIEIQEHILNQVVQKGSITLDGVSLTVAQIDKASFSVSLIPFTAHETILGEKKVGDTVNVETDIIGKYVEKYLVAYNESCSKGITLSLLKEHGFA